VEYVNPEVLQLAKTLPGPGLDFGCGTGGLVDALREAGMECFGLELKTKPIRRALPKQRKKYVKLYSGKLPLPYKSDHFETVIVSEVLEHLIEPEPVMQEIARICKGNLLVTVPDISVIPLHHKHGVVPWHLLESTHVNFYNPTSLQHFLSRWFPEVELYKIGRTQTNGTEWWAGLMALARK
jgi:2-polyprenyl-3-methyl-5-hydroxy-6-metoxy-1,4-benzoquinol methylase